MSAETDSDDFRAKMLTEIKKIQEEIRDFKQEIAKKPSKKKPAVKKNAKKRAAKQKPIKKIGKFKRKSNG